MVSKCDRKRRNKCLLLVTVERKDGGGKEKGRTRGDDRKEGRKEKNTIHTWSKRKGRQGKKGSQGWVVEGRTRKWERKLKERGGREKDGDVGKTSGEKGSEQKREIGSEVRERKRDRKQDRMRGNIARKTDDWENNERKD